MEQYIKKSALVAEIERRKNYYENIQMIKPVYESNIEDFNELLSFIDTLEVKEVDFEEELKHYCNDYYNCDYSKQIEEGSCSEVMPHIVSAAKHFFELGLKAQKGE